MKTLKFEVPDDLYEVFLQMAAKEGRTTEAVALEWLVKYAPKPRPKLSEEERRAAKKRFEQHFGSVSLGHPTGADNESIDADLVREYDVTHEEEK
ncbi:MAG: hypothetical protein HYR55_13900 [Acidobacteria bacterium]|nr:hypothetical protein [Acidobacteriota bacterium]MBI3655842.1 hypothetical protein [Acidobacteriota bacterium]